MMESLGFDHYIWYDLPTSFKDFYAIVASSPECHLVAFRGTKTPKDWMTDLASTPARFEWVFSGGPSLGEIHSGFGHCLADAFQRLILPLAKCDQNRPLLITGHSLGGALAALAGICFTALHSSVPPISAIYTFGQPRVGLRDFCESYSRFLPKKLIRFVNKRDIVPRVPFRAWDYSDYGQMIHFDSTEIPVINSAEWQNFLTETYGSFGEM
jgi:triacylglycerol lipase